MPQSCALTEALTQMLKDPLSGHSSHITVMLALRSEKNHDHETLSTMRFGNVCRGAAGANGVRRKTANKVEQADSERDGSRLLAGRML